MFARRLSIERIDARGDTHACPISWIDNFAMRNFTNDAVFDDTLPVSDGILEAGYHVPLDRLRTSMEDWFRRKGYLAREERLRITEEAYPPRDDNAPKAQHIPAWGEAPGKRFLLKGKG